MVTDLAQPATFARCYDPAAHQLRAAWYDNVSEADLRAQYRELLTSAQAHGNCCFWLLDISQRDWHVSTFGRWFIAEFAPQLHAALRQPVFMAFVLSAAHQEVANTPNVQAMQFGSANCDVYPFLFSNEADALAWLAHQQRLDVAQAA